MAMNAFAIQADLAWLKECSMTVRCWFAKNDILLNAGKSEVVFLDVISAGYSGRQCFVAAE
jgi:hypothetical protein